MGELSRPIEPLEKRIEALERRVYALEHLHETTVPAQPPVAEVPAVATAQPPAQGTAGSVFPLLGRALLGIAGAYLLRAVEEASALPKPVAAAAGIAYAFLLLVWAARARAGAQLASAIYACTSALVLAPMLWELTLRFKLLPAEGTAAVVCGYAIAAVGLYWISGRKPLLRAAYAASVVLALLLAVASHHLMPFIVVLLVFAAIREFTPRLDTFPELGALTALAADAAIWILISIYYQPPSARGESPALGNGALLAPGLLLFLISVAGVGIQTLVRRQPIAIGTAIQAPVAFLLGAVSLADFGPPNRLAILGIACLLFSAAGIVAVFTVFNRAESRRNAEVFSAWSAALLLAGSFESLPLLAAHAVLSAAALAATIAGSRKNRLSLEFYGIVFLLFAWAAAGLPGFIANAFAGMQIVAPGLSAFLVSLCAILCYALARHGAVEGWLAQTLHLGSALLAVGAVCALAVAGLAGLIALPGAHQLAFIRTLVLCVAAISLAYGGAYGHRRELTWLGYAALVLVACKLVLEDMRLGHLAYIAGSIVLVALTLIVAPRAARGSRKA